MKVAILGYGGQGQSALEYWTELGNEIIVCDKNKELVVPDGVSTQLGDRYLDNLDQFDLLVRTPALHPSEITKANNDAPNILDKVSTVTNEFFRVCPSRNIIGVTGTKGKGTTSSLIAKMLEAAGHRVHLGGNIGISPIELLKDGIKPQDYVVLELANFQLIDLRYSPHIAVCLMMAPEHLDWHANYQEYLDSKKPLFAHQTAQDVAISFADNPNSFQIADVSKGKKIPYYSPPGAWIKDEQDIVIDNVVVCHTSDISLLGKHNWQNVCAAITAVWQISHDINAIGRVIRSFTGLEHRLELVRELDSVKYYNDSFASTPPATEAAMDSITGTKIMIIGGFDRGLDLKGLVQSIISHASDIKHTFLIGQTGVKIAEVLLATGYSNYTVLGNVSMTQIVDTARGSALPGDSIVLSPGAASFDMFKNFEDRGNQYKDCVNKL